MATPGERICLPAVARRRFRRRAAVGEFDPAAPSQASLRQIDEYLGTVTAKGEIVRAEIRTIDGQVLAGTDAAAVTRTSPASPDFSAAVAGTPSVAIVSADQAASD